MLLLKKAARILHSQGHCLRVHLVNTLNHFYFTVNSLPTCSYNITTFINHAHMGRLKRHVTTPLDRIGRKLSQRRTLCTRSTSFSSPCAEADFSETTDACVDGPDRRVIIRRRRFIDTISSCCEQWSETIALSLGTRQKCARRETRTD